MNKNSLIESLFQLLSRFKYHPDFITELIKILTSTGVDAHFLSVFEARLTLLYEHGRDAVNIAQGYFERLKNTRAPLYSMRLKTKRLNLRILYSVSADGTIMLLPFWEKDDSYNGRYEKYIPIAEKRIHDFEEDYHGQ